MPPESADPESDRLLVRRVLGRDAGATDELLGRLRCIPAILRLRNRRLGGPLDDALLQDLAQDVLVALWPKLGQYGGAAPLEGWVYRFCVNKHLALVRDRGLRTRIEVSESALSDDSSDRPRAPRSQDVTPNEHLDTELLERALETLDSQPAAIVRLKHFDEQTFDQIGARLDIPPNTAKTQYYRALKRLRETLTRRETG